jgi:hypothetical protein
MANRRYKQFQGTLESGIVKLYGSVTVGSSGAISSSSVKGFTIAKTAGETGRYTVTLNDKYNALKHVSVIVVGPADAALTDASGIIASLRNDAVATSKTFDIQFSRNTTLADTEITSGNKFLFEITLKNSAQTF